MSDPRPVIALLERALAAFKRDEPKLYAWVAEGHPAMTEVEHVERFGEPYRPRRAKRGAA